MRGAALWRVPGAPVLRERKKNTHVMLIIMMIIIIVIIITLNAAFRAHQSWLVNNNNN